MRLSGILAGATAALVLSASAATGIVSRRCLSAYPDLRVLLPIASLLLGTGLAALATIFILAWVKTRRRALAVAGLLGFLVLAPLASMWYPGRVTYAEFGLTVYGIVPVPFLDVTVGPHGLLGFRDKTHHVTLDDVRSLVNEDTDLLIIGAGWTNGVQVDDAVITLARVKVHVLSTPEALRLFNKCRSEGKRVVLIAHSTC